MCACDHAVVGILKLWGFVKRHLLREILEWLHTDPPPCGSNPLAEAECVECKGHTRQPQPQPQRESGATPSVIKGVRECPHAACAA